MPAAARGVPGRAFIGTYSALLKSNVGGRWKSFAASVPSGSYKPQKGQRKSKEERRAMIEAFVDKYKASNAGKFPTASHVHQEIGGSYYVVREIIQELEYNHRIFLSNKVQVVQFGKAEKIIDPSSAAKGQLLSNEETMLTSSTTAKVKSNMKSIDRIIVDECPLPKHGEANMHLEANRERAIEKPSVEESVSPVVMVVDPSSTPFGVAKERLQDSAQVSNRDQKSNASASSIASEQVVSSSKPSDKEVHSDLDSLKGGEQIGNHEAPKTEELHHEHPRSSEHVETSPKTANFWENLKSLTEGIINFWKKM